MTYDLVIKNGTVIDPAQGIRDQRDVAISGGRIAAVEADIGDSNTHDVVEADGLLVTPGLVDLHVHVWWGVAHLAIEVDSTSLARGATTVVDAGSSGSNTVAGLHRYVIDQSNTRTVAFLNISGMGQLDLDIGELEDIRWARVDKAVEAARLHGNVIVGMKVRRNDMTGLQRALDAAIQIDKPLMVHIGNTHHPLEEILRQLRPGDIVTHSFHGIPRGIIADNGRVIAAAVEARERGVIFDVGHGRGAFSFDVAEKALADGFPPGTVSSDVHRYNVRGPVYDLATTLSKYLLMGLSLDEVIALGTERPARAVGLQGQAGSLKVGAPADVAVFRLENDPVQLYDTLGVMREGHQLLVPVVTIRNGRRFAPSHGRHPNLIQQQP